MNHIYFPSMKLSPLYCYMENKATKDPMSKKKLLMHAKSNGPYLVQGLGVYPYEAALRGLQLVLFLVVLEYTSSHMHAI